MHEIKTGVPYMGGSQNYGPFLAIEGVQYQSGTLILGTTHAATPREDPVCMFRQTRPLISHN